MTTQQIYTMTDNEYKLFRDATLGISCPNLSEHECYLCPMNVNILRGFGKDPEFRCLLGMMETALSNMEDRK